VAEDRPVALVTGAASGIGRATAQRLSDDGMSVLAVDLRPDPDGPGEPHEADLTSREGNRGAVQAALDRFDRLDAVIANAGFQHVAPVGAFPEDRWDAMLALMLTSPFLLARYAWDALAAAPEARFIGVASVLGVAGAPYKAAYVAAKHGLVGLVKTIALEGAEVGILASAICPAFVRTPLVEGQIDDLAREHGLARERVLDEVILAPAAVKRLLEPEEVAGVISFLLGPGGRAFTGAAIPLDLGQTAH
jgi:3-hydroxybutyrate dehydrogenase